MESTRTSFYWKEYSTASHEFFPTSDHYHMKPGYVSWDCGPWKKEGTELTDLIELFKLMKGLSSTPWSHFFKKAEDTSTRGHTWKLVKKHCHCDSRLYFFSQTVINRWNKLSQEDVDVQSINCFKNRLEKRRTRQMDFFKDLYSTSPIGCKKGQTRTCAWMDYKMERLCQVQPHPVNTR